MKKLLIICSVLFLVSCSAVGVKPDNGSGQSGNAKKHQGHASHKSHKGYKGHEGHGIHKGESCHKKHGSHSDHGDAKGHGKHPGKSCHKKHGAHSDHGDAKGHGKYFAAISYIKHHLTLDKAQLTKLDVLMRKMKQNNKVAHDQMKLVSKELHDAIKSKSDDAVLTKLLNKKAAIHTQLELQQIHVRQTVMAMLTDKQRQKVMKKLHAHKANH